MCIRDSVIADFTVTFSHLDTIQLIYLLEHFEPNNVLEIFDGKIVISSNPNNTFSSAQGTHLLTISTPFKYIFSK